MPLVWGMCSAQDTELVSNLAPEPHFLLAITARHYLRKAILRFVVLMLLIILSDSSKRLVVFSPLIRQTRLN